MRAQDAVRKGDQLERSVEIIERVILGSKSLPHDCKTTIEPKKVVVVNNVKHEIDLFVELDLGHDYISTYIFECKNWERSVGKNEIILFSEKIEAVQAQKGYFVAKEFGRYAKAQAKRNSRMQLLLAKETPVEPFQFLPNFNFIMPQLNNIDVEFTSDDSTNKEKQKIDVRHVPAILRGEEIDLQPHLHSLGEEAMDRRLKRESTAELPSGTYEYVYSEGFDFDEGELIVAGENIKELSLTIEFSNTVIWPRIVSQFDIETRGRVIRLEKISVGEDGQVEFAFVMQE